MIRSLPFVPSSCYHDFKYYSIFYGEPFLFEDYLYYFDGWDLTVIGYDRYGNAIEENTFESLLTSVLDQWQVRSVTLETPKRLRLGNRFRFVSRQILGRPELENDFEFVIPSEVGKTSKIRKAVRRARKQGVLTRVARRKEFTHHHYKLIDEYIRSWEACAYYKSEYVGSLFSLLLRPRTILVNAYIDDVLVGFSIGNVIRTFGIHRILITKPNVPGVSDALHDTTIDALWKLGANEVSLGFSINAGLAAFKRKWGGERRWQGSFVLFWSRTKTPPHYLWATRIARAR